MGYETKLLIGHASSQATDEFVYGDLIVEEGEAYRPMLKDDENNYLRSGRKETYFQIMATLDLCKCGHDSAIHDLDRVNKDESHFWMTYEGDERIIEDRYGEKLKPVPVSDVIAAIKIDNLKEDYRRFNWALALLESMVDDKQDITVLLFGH